jgi:hypothetical protein
MGSFFSAIGRFIKDISVYMFEDIPRFFVVDIPELLWAFIKLVTTELEDITIFIKALLIFIGQMFGLVIKFVKILELLPRFIFEDIPDLVRAFVKLLIDQIDAMIKFNEAIFKFMGNIVTLIKGIFKIFGGFFGVLFSTI